VGRRSETARTLVAGVKAVLPRIVTQLRHYSPPAWWARKPLPAGSEARYSSPTVT